MHGFDISTGRGRGAAPTPAASGAVSIAKAVAGAEIVVITMLPEGRHVRTVYMDQGGVFAAAPRPDAC